MYSVGTAVDVYNYVSYSY